VESGLLEIGSLEVGFLQVRSSEVRVEQDRPAEASRPEIGLREICIRKLPKVAGHVLAVLASLRRNVHAPGIGAPLWHRYDPDVWGDHKSHRCAAVLREGDYLGLAKRSADQHGRHGGRIARFAKGALKGRRLSGMYSNRYGARRAGTGPVTRTGSSPRKKS
jgi:hypothetical protein